MHRCTNTKYEIKDQGELNIEQIKLFLWNNRKVHSSISGIVKQGNAKVYSIFISDLAVLAYTCRIHPLPKSFHFLLKSKFFQPPSWLCSAPQRCGCPLKPQGLGPASSVPLSDPSGKAASILQASKWLRKKAGLWKVLLWRANLSENSQPKLCRGTVSCFF